MARSRLTVGLRKNPPYKTYTNRRGVPVVLYDTALNSMAYGAPAQLGDLFNDVMGAVVPGWDARPDWMKKIVVKPDPVKIMAAAANVVKPQQAGALVDQAAKAGVNLWYTTPAGQVPVNGAMVAGGMQYGPGVFSASNALSSIPTWAYMAGGAAILLMFAMRK